jgi:hypothetical protein
MALRYPGFARLGGQEAVQLCERGQWTSARQQEIGGDDQNIPAKNPGEVEPGPQRRDALDVPARGDLPRLQIHLVANHPFASEGSAADGAAQMEHVVVLQGQGQGKSPEQRGRVMADDCARDRPNGCGAEQQGCFGCC